MAISRRSFLKGSGLAAASSLVAPALLGNPFIRRAFADTIGDRYFLLIYLVLALGTAVSATVAIFSAHRIALLLCLFVPLPVAVGLASPVIQIAIRRYTTPDTQTLAFATQ